MSNSSETSISRVLQDTFDELQGKLGGDGASQGAPGLQAVEGELLELFSRLASNQGFSIQKVLGSGGMGAVVKARDMKLNRTVALKFLPPQVLSDAKHASELRQEAEVASSIQNENVVQIFSWHEVEEVPFFAMEFVEGETVEEMVRRRGRLPVLDALRITAEAARGLEALHLNGIIHRDIKPQNIMIAADGRVKIADFGISRTQDKILSDIHKVRTIAGTPKFMAPEQARGEAATKQSDIYSLGATLYYMLSGRSPVEPASDVRLQLLNVREGRLIALHKVMPKLHRELARLVMASLSTNPARRPLDIVQFRRRIEGAFLFSTERAYGPLRRLVRRHSRAVFPILALLMGIGTGYLAGVTWMRERAPKEDVAFLEALAPLVESQKSQLLRALVLDGENVELRRQLGRIQTAETMRDWPALLRAIHSADGALEQWIDTRAAQLYARDENSQLWSQARAYLDALSTQNTEQISTTRNAWREAWVNFSLK